MNSQLYEKWIWWWWCEWLDAVYRHSLPLSLYLDVLFRLSIKCSRFDSCHFRILEKVCHYNCSLIACSVGAINHLSSCSYCWLSLFSSLPLALSICSFLTFFYFYFGCTWPYSTVPVPACSHGISGLRPIIWLSWLELNSATDPSGQTWAGERETPH